MQKRSKQLNVIQDNGTSSRVVTGTTCFSVQAKHGIDCQRTHCRQWITNPESHNCVIIASQEGPHTLQKIGKIYGLTRMRICQIEKTIFEKIKQIS